MHCIKRKKINPMKKHNLHKRKLNQKQDKSLFKFMQKSDTIVDTITVQDEIDKYLMRGFFFHGH